MNILDIKNRLRQLNAQKFLSDDEHEEKEQLLEELALRRSGVREETKLIPVGHPKAEPKRPREHSVVGKTMIKIVKGLIEHMKEKPVTFEELEDLKMKAAKYRLKADIAKSKRTIRGPTGNPLGNSGTRRTSKRTSDPTDNISSVLRGSVKGSTNHTFFTERSHKDIRKSFYG